jgi:hypothetical protein
MDNHFEDRVKKITLEIIAAIRGLKVIKTKYAGSPPQVLPGA